MCGGLRVSRCGNYDWRLRPESGGAHISLRLTKVIRP
jgi:hypothetical protein